MIGGRIIEISPMTLVETGAEVVRLWCVNQPDDEACVYVEEFPAATGPRIGDEIWWQGSQVFYARDTKHLVKVGYSFSPRRDGQ